MNSDYTMEDMERFFISLLELTETGEKAAKVVRNVRGMAASELAHLQQAMKDTEKQ